MYDAQAEISSTLPASYRLYQNYPNPFNSSTRISYYLPESTDLTIEVINIHGKVIKTLYDNGQLSGSHSCTWDGTDSHNNPVASGLLFYRISAGNYSETLKMLLLK